MPNICERSVANQGFGEGIAANDTVKEKPDLELILESREGNRDALDELFRRHYPYSIWTARRILGSEDDSRDAVQTAYLSAFQHLSSFREEASFKT